MKKKIISNLVVIMIFIGILLTLIESYNFRNHGIHNALNSAKSISEVVKNGLTAHMINGNMDQRDVFLNSISSMKNIEKLWIVRGENVSKQYGDAKNSELPRDDIDLKVLNSSKMEYELEESFTTATMRVTIPYNAIDTNAISCVNCHLVKYGDNLGAVSIVIDITDFKTSGLNLILMIMFFTILAVALLVYFANKLLKPDLETIEELSLKIKNISNGKFTNIIKKDKLSFESKNLIKEYNLLVNGLSITMDDIDKKLNIFVGNRSYDTTNPLVKAQKVISNLAEIYQFKKEIEIDSTKDEIYKRLSYILINKFNLNSFTFMEQDINTNKTTIVYNYGEDNYCSSEIFDNPNLCRLTRTTNDVWSTKDQNTCPHFTNSSKLYYCFDIDIGIQTKLVLNFIFDTEEEFESLKKNISSIKNYVLEAAPSITVKILLEELKDSAFKDGLTGLYNRKFFDEHITKLVPQALRENINIGILMLDMDHFKSVNDEYGHDVGDIVLKELSTILTNNVRDSDIIIRYGGEEFIILLVGVQDEDSALNIANKIRMQVSQNEIDIYAGNKLKKTISIGLSMFPQDSTNIDIVMKNADIALYEAKDKGRNMVARYEDKNNIEIF